MPFLSVVVPVHHGAERLPARLHDLREFLTTRSFTTELVLVDDGSEPVAAGILADFAATRAAVTLIRNHENRGKGYSVARGMLAARGAYRVFTDADLAYPPPEILKILGRLQEGADVAIACRVMRDSRYLMSPTFFRYLYTRHVASRVLNRLVRIVLLPGLLDTQAGLKGFSARAATLIFPRISIAGFGFDLECLYIARAQGLRIAETAVEFRYDEEPTTVRFAKDGTRVLRDLAAIRWNAWRRRYR